MLQQWMMVNWHYHTYSGQAGLAKCLWFMVNLIQYSVMTLHIVGVDTHCHALKLCSCTLCGSNRSGWVKLQTPASSGPCAAHKKSILLYLVRFQSLISSKDAISTSWALQRQDSKNRKRPCHKGRTFKVNEMPCSCFFLVYLLIYWK